MEFVTGHAGTDHISAADMASLYRGLLISDDVVLDTGSQLECTMLDANTAEIGTGDCMLQAHHARVEVAEQLTIQSGSNGYNRNDLIVARYSLGTGNVQTVYLAVIEGTAVAGEAEDPTYATGDIDSGSTLVEFPLWRIPLTGITVGTPERIMPTIDTLQEQITSVQNSVSNIGILRIDRKSNINTTNNATTVICQVDITAGTWIFIGGIEFNANATGVRIAKMASNSSATASCEDSTQVQACTGSDMKTIVRASYILNYAEPKTIYLMAYQNSGSTLKANGALYALRVK